MAEGGGGHNENIEFKLNLDAKEFVEELLHAKENILHLAHAENLEGLIAGLKHASLAIGAIGVAALALHVTLESVFETEAIEKINKQFDILTKNAGISGVALREGLLEAVQGFADETEVLAAANKAIGAMGASAAKLPEVMELARKSTAIMGGDLLENFEKLNHALASGNQRSLRQLGIVVDVSKAVKDYAAAHGLAANEVTETGRRQAVLNAALEKGQTALAGIKPPIDTATTSWTKFKVAIKETTEVMTKAVGKSVFGEIWVNIFRQMKSAALDVRDIVFTAFGDDAEKARAKVSGFEKQIVGMESGLRALNEARAKYEKQGRPAAVLEQMDKAIEAQKARIEQAKHHLEEFRHANEAIMKTKAGEKPAEEGGGEAGPEAVDLDKRRANRARFEADIARLHQERIKSEMDMNLSLEQADVLHLQNRENATKQTAARIQEIRSSDRMNESQKNQMIAEEHAALNTKLIQMDFEAAEHKKTMIRQKMELTTDFDRFEELIESQKEVAKQERDARLLMLEQAYTEQRKQILMNRDLDDTIRRQQLDELDKLTKDQKVQAEQNFQDQLTQIHAEGNRQRTALIDKWVQAGDGAANQFARGFQSASMKASMELANFGKQGEKVAGMFSSHMTEAFMKMGEGSKKGSEVVKEAALGMIADIAQYYGSMLLLTGIWPPNPLALGAGAGLLMLAGMLRGMAKKGAGVGMPGGGTSSGMGDIGGAPSALANTNLATDNQRQAKAVHLEIHGNLIETEGAQRHITEMVRNALDATDFSIARVGGGI